MVHICVRYRVVNVSSTLSKTALQRCSEPLRNELLALKTEADISRYMKKFVR